MTQETTGTAGLPTSGFVVTHYLRPGDSALQWQVWGSAELSAADAIATIQQRAKEAGDLGFADPAAGAPLLGDPGPGVPAVVPDPPAAVEADPAAPQLGSS